jgi:hypothetical protein
MQLLGTKNAIHILVSIRVVGQLIPVVIDTITDATAICTDMLSVSVTTMLEKTVVAKQWQPQSWNIPLTGKTLDCFISTMRLVVMVGWLVQ